MDRYSYSLSIQTDEHSEWFVVRNPINDTVLGTIEVYITGGLVDYRVTKPDLTSHGVYDSFYEALRSLVSED